MAGEKQSLNLRSRQRRNCENQCGIRNANGSDGYGQISKAKQLSNQRLPASEF